MKKIVILCLIVMLVLPVVSADVIMPGTRGISYCARITNVNDYPDYVFFSYNVGPMPPENEKGEDTRLQVLDDGSCINIGYKFNSVSIYTMEKGKFAEFNITKANLSELWNNLNDNQKEEIKKKYDNLFRNYDVESFIKNDNFTYYKENLVWIKNELINEIYLNYNDDIILLEERITQISSTWVFDPREEITDNFKIKTNGNGNLVLEKSRSYDYGLVTLFFYLIPLICLIAIITILIRRKGKKK